MKHLTHHAEVRMNQRGFRHADIALILETAEQIGPDAYMMTCQAADYEIARRKREIQQFERLKGKKLIVAGDAIITGYHVTPREEKRTFRIGRAST